MIIDIYKAKRKLLSSCPRERPDRRYISGNLSTPCGEPRKKYHVITVPFAKHTYDCVPCSCQLRVPRGERPRPGYSCPGCNRRNYPAKYCNC